MQQISNEVFKNLFKDLCCSLSESNISIAYVPAGYSDLSDTSICITKWDATFPKMFPDENSDHVAPHITWHLSISTDQTWVFSRIKLEYFYGSICWQARNFRKSWLTSLFTWVSSTLGIKPWCFSITASSLLYSSFLSSPARSLKSFIQMYQNVMLAC